MTAEKPLLELPAGTADLVRTIQDKSKEARAERAESVKAITAKINDLDRDLRETLARALGIESAWQVDLSYDWRCPHSPIGTCTYTPGIHGCRFCGDPKERK
jgi:hypothetical protein